MLVTDSKLITLLRQCSAYELNRFKRFVESPYLNENEELVHLLDIILPALKSREEQQPLNSKQLNKKVVWEKLYPGQKFKDIKLRRLSSDLTQLAFQFMYNESLKEEPQHQQIRLMDLMNQKKLDKHFRGLRRQFEKEMEALPWQNAPFHFYHFRAEEVRQAFLEGPGLPFEDLSSLEQADFHLDCYYFSKKLKHYCDALGYESFLSLKAELSQADDLLDRIQQGPYLKVPAIKAYHLVATMLLKPEEEEHFFRLQDFLKNHAALFPPKELKTLYIHLNNYCIIKKINAGQGEFFNHLFANYQLMLAHGLMLDEDQMAAQDYKNIITVGLQVKAYEWVEKFIQEYTNKLPATKQENALTYNLAKVYFAQRKYDQVIEQLREVAHSNHIYALGGKQILLKTYYETDEFLPLDSLIQSFRAYLRRNRVISKDVRNQYLNFLRFLKKLSYLAPHHKEKMEKLRKDIQDCDSVAQRSWLLEKINELK
jgi:hypothetical protein